jgi:threonine dehydratase
MWPLLCEEVRASIVVELSDAARAMALVAEHAHVIAEGAAACAVAAARSSRLAQHQRIVAIVSGGNIDLSRFAALTGACE